MDSNSENEFTIIYHLLRFFIKNKSSLTNPVKRIIIWAYPSPYQSRVGLSGTLSAALRSNNTYYPLREKRTIAEFVKEQIQTSKPP